MNNRERIEKAFRSLAIPVFEGAGLAEKGAAPEHRRVTVLLTGSNIQLSDALAALQELKAAGYFLTLVVSSSAEKVLGEKPVREIGAFKVIREGEMQELQRLIQTTDWLIAPNLTQNHLAKCAVGIQDDLPSVLLWQCLVTGTSVLINTASVFNGWFPLDQNRAMKTVMEGHLRTVSGFGADFMEDYDYLQRLQGQDRTPSVRQQRQERKRVTHHDTSRGTVKRTDDRVISEQTIRGMGVSVKKVTVGKGQILTPLAKDYCISRGIEVVYERRTT